MSRDPLEDARYGDLPGEYSNSRGFSVTPLKNFLYQSVRLGLFYCPELKTYSTVGQTDGDFRASLRDVAREQRDREIEKLREEYKSKLERIEERIRKAEQRVDREEAQAAAAKRSTWSYIGQNILGAVLGKGFRTSSIGTSARSASRAADQAADVRIAEEDVRKYKDDLRELERELEDEVDAIHDRFQEDRISIEPYEVKPRKSDITVDEIGLVWLPWTLTEDGHAEPAYRTE